MVIQFYKNLISSNVKTSPIVNDGPSMGLETVSKSA